MGLFSFLFGKSDPVFEKEITEEVVRFIKPQILKAIRAYPPRHLHPSFPSLSDDNKVIMVFATEPWVWLYAYGVASVCMNLHRTNFTEQSQNEKIITNVINNIFFSFTAGLPSQRVAHSSRMQQKAAELAANRNDYEYFPAIEKGAVDFAGHWATQTEADGVYRRLNIKFQIEAGDY